MQGRQVAPDLLDQVAVDADGDVVAIQGRGEARVVAARARTEHMGLEAFEEVRSVGALERAVAAEVRPGRRFAIGANPGRAHERKSRRGERHPRAAREIDGRPRHLRVVEDAEDLARSAEHEPRLRKQVLLGGGEHVRLLADEVPQELGERGEPRFLGEEGLGDAVSERQDLRSQVGRPPRHLRVGELHFLAHPLIGGDPQVPVRFHRGVGVQPGERLRLGGDRLERLKHRGCRRPELTREPPQSGESSVHAPFLGRKRLVGRENVVETPGLVRNRGYAHSGSSMVPEEGVEPSRPQGSGDFESPASAIPPLRPGGQGAYRPRSLTVKAAGPIGRKSCRFSSFQLPCGLTSEEAPLDFKVGDKVVYPNHGVGVIEQVTKKSVGDIVASFYCLRIISTDSTVMVPVGNTIAVGLRKVLTRREVVRVMDVLRTGEVATYDDWKGRFQANSEKMRTGDIRAVAEVLKSLTILAEIKPLSYRERKMLDRARFLLVSELAEAGSKTPEKVEIEIDAALADSVKGAKVRIAH